MKEKINELIRKVKSFRLFIVPVGELEGWIDLGTIRKDIWILNALEKLCNDECPQDLKNFVNEAIKSMNN